MRHHDSKSVHEAEPTGRPSFEPVARADSAPVAVEAQVARARALSGGGVAGLPLGDPGRAAAIVTLQRTRGNAAVQRLLVRDPGVARGRAVQRHTSVELEEPENTIRRTAIQRDLAADITEARGITGWFSDEDKIFASIDAASADERRAILNNPTMLADLRKVLKPVHWLTALQKLGASLADQLDLALAGTKTGMAAMQAAAMGGPQGDSAAVFAAIESPRTSADQKAAVLRNSALMARLRTNLSQAQACLAVRKLGGPLTEQLVAATEGGDGDVAAIVSAVSLAPVDQRLAARRDRALVTRLIGALGQDLALTLMESLGTSVSDRLTMVLDGFFTDKDAIFAIAEKADEKQRRELLTNPALLRRLRDDLGQKDIARLYETLHASLTDRIDVAL